MWACQPHDDDSKHSSPIPQPLDGTEHVDQTVYVPNHNKDTSHKVLRRGRGWNRERIKMHMGGGTRKGS